MSLVLNHSKHFLAVNTAKMKEKKKVNTNTKAHHLLLVVFNTDLWGKKKKFPLQDVWSRHYSSLHKLRAAELKPHGVRKQ